MESYISNIKIKFVTGVILLAVLITGGSFMLRHNNVFSGKNIERNFNYFKYKSSLGGGSPLLASVGSLFSNTSNTAQSTEPANEIPVLLYHGIVPVSDGFSITQEKFAEQLSALKNAGYNTITIDDLYQYIYNGKVLPENSFLLSFDDGRKDSFYGGDPILKALDYSAVMFTATGVSLPEIPGKASTYYLSPAEIKNMNKSGRWEIESHAVQKEGGLITINEEGDRGNFLSNKMWIAAENRLETNEEYENRIANEFASSKRAIESNLENSAISFSYPFGDFGEQSINLSQEYTKSVIRKNVAANYKLAFHQIWPVDHEYTHNSKGDDPYMLKRIEPSPEWSGADLLFYIDTGKTKKLPYRDEFSRNQGWKNIWGNLIVSGGNLSTGASSKTNGSFTFLDGTLSWSDYKYTANVDWQSGTHLVIAGRYQNPDNYMSCIISDDNARIEEITSGKKNKLAESKIDFKIDKHPITVTLELYNKKASCVINGKVVVKTENISDLLWHGGIGLKTWDENLGLAGVNVMNINVSNVDMASSAISPLEFNQ